VRIDADDGFLVGSEWLFGIELVLQHGEVSIRGIAS
jgi:hypothetical protein